MKFPPILISVRGCAPATGESIADPTGLSFYTASAMGDFPLRHPHDPPIRREGSRGTTIILHPGRYDGPPTLMASAMARTVPMISTATAGAWPLSRNEARNPEKKRMVVPLPKAKNGASGNKFPLGRDITRGTIRRNMSGGFCQCPMPDLYPFARSALLQCVGADL